MIELGIMDMEAQLSIKSTPYCFGECESNGDKDNCHVY